MKKVLTVSMIVLGSVIFATSGFAAVDMFLVCKQKNGDCLKACEKMTDAVKKADCVSKCRENNNKCVQDAKTKQLNTKK